MKKLLISSALIMGFASLESAEAISTPDRADVGSSEASSSYTSSREGLKNEAMMGGGGEAASSTASHAVSSKETRKGVQFDPTRNEERTYQKDDKQEYSTYEELQAARRERIAEIQAGDGEFPDSRRTKEEVADANKDWKDHYGKGRGGLAAIGRQGGHTKLPSADAVETK